jgi:dethiobiotin synthetase
VRGVFVTGTDTGVGKTVVAGAVAAALTRVGRRVAAYKPVVTGLDDPPAPGWAHDHELLAAATGSAPTAVSPWRFGPPASPRLAAALAGTTLSLAAMAAAGRTAAGDAELIVVEGVGGLLVPLTPRGETVRDLACELGLPLLVAARPGLGTINHTLLTLEAARAAALDVLAVVLTPWPQQPSVVEQSNRETIADLGGVEVAVLPAAPDGTPAALAAAARGLPLARWLDG